MKPDPRFLAQSKEFWANVRIISQEVGYTQRGKDGAQSAIKVPTLVEIRAALNALKLDNRHIASHSDELTPLGEALLSYFDFRATVLNNTVRTQLMDKAAAEMEFKRLQMALKPSCPLPMNKQKGDKRNHSFLTGIVNMLIEAGRLYAVSSGT